MAIDLPVFPINRWDESRLAVNAIEMHATGLSLVTTYGFRPDLWNTKPPLLIWLMSLCMSAFGTSEGALRIPSALATLGSAAIAMGFTWKLTRTSFAPAAAGVVLLTTRGFVGRHSGQTADYEALLCFFVTAYSCLFFHTLHRRRPKPWQVLLAGALVAGAALTKGVAGLAPGAGLVLYLIVQRRPWRPFQSWSYPVAAVIAAGLVAAFYLGREHAAPGYLRAVATNELGRYGVVVENHHTPIWYYPLLIFGAFGFSLGVFALPLLAEVRWVRGRRRAGMVFALCMAFAIMAIYTAGKTRIRWYTDPCHPFLAIGCAIGLDSLRIRLRARRGPAAVTPAWERAGLWGGAAVLVLVIFIVRDLYPTIFDQRSTGTLRRGLRRPAPAGARPGGGARRRRLQRPARHGLRAPAAVLRRAVARAGRGGGAAVGAGRHPAGRGHRVLRHHAGAAACAAGGGPGACAGVYCGGPHHGAGWLGLEGRSG